MQNNEINFLFIGDIVGRGGREIVQQMLPSLKAKYEIDMVVANGENTAGGMGITPRIAADLFSCGIDVITSGNHIWKRKEIIDFLKEEKRILRPLNYPSAVPGRGSIIYEAGNKKIGVINLMGRTFLSECDCPFRQGMEEVERMRRTTKVIIVDMHSEATSEKVAMGWYLDGYVSAVIGTHTHVQTADERILAQGTAYITDVGMSGPRDSVIGIKKELALSRFITLMPVKFEVAEGENQLCSLFIKIDSISGKAKTLKRLWINE